MRDGSLLFFTCPDDLPWDEVCARVARLGEGEITDFTSDLIAEFWLDFSFREYKFSIHNPLGELWFFSEDATCPQTILNDVIAGLRI